jgi:hypothetical protein
MLFVGAIQGGGKQMGRWLRLSVTLLVAVCALVVAAPAPAQAYYQNYCGVVKAPWDDCYSDGLHSWDFNRASYPGPPQHNVGVCEYMWNNRTHAIRGGIHPCDNNYVSYYYGPTTQADYNARVYIDGSECCPHTIDGYADT